LDIRANNFDHFSESQSNADKQQTKYQQLAHRLSDPAFHLQSADTIRNLLLEFLFFDISLTLGRKRKLAKVRGMQVRTMIRYHSSFKPAGTDWEPVDLTVYASRNAFGFAVALLRSIKQN
jgi:hypothetical protein